MYLMEFEYFKLNQVSLRIKFFELSQDFEFILFYYKLGQG